MEFDNALFQDEAGAALMGDVAFLAQSHGFGTHAAHTLEEPDFLHEYAGPSSDSDSSSRILADGCSIISPDVDSPVPTYVSSPFRPDDLPPQVLLEVGTPSLFDMDHPRGANMDGNVPDVASFLSQAAMEVPLPRNAAVTTTNPTLISSDLGGDVCKRGAATGPAMQSIAPRLIQVKAEDMPALQRPVVLSDSDVDMSGRKRKTTASSTPSAASSAAKRGPAGKAPEEKGVTAKHQERLMRNRVSAQLSRERKKEYMRTLEDKIHSLTALNQQLLQENAALRRRLDALDGGGGDAGADSAFGDTQPACKRQKGARAAYRTGAVLFALVMSFGVFYGLVGMNPSDPRDLSLLSSEADIPAAVLKGRVLLSAPAEEEDERKKAVATLPSKAVIAINTGATDEEKRDDHDDTDSDGDRLMADAEAKNAAAVKVLHAAHISKLSRQLQEKMRACGLNMTVPEGYQEIDAKAESAEDNGVSSDANANAMAVDIYRQNTEQIHANLAKALDMYKKLWLDSNGALGEESMPTSIMFCPSAVHIVPTRTGAHNKEQNSKAVVPAPTRPATKLAAKIRMDGSAPAEPTATPTAPQNMLLWVPSNALAADWEVFFNKDGVNVTATPRKQSDGASAQADVKHDGVTEINVKVAGVRTLVS